MATQEARLPGRISFEEFLSAYDGIHAEWVDGTVQVMSPGNERQSKLTQFLSAVMQQWAESKDLGEVYVPPFTVRMLEEASREPDLFFVRREHLSRVRDTYVEGPPDLVVEVASRSSRTLDRGEKFREYERAGVPEYWLIDPERETAGIYRLGAGGTYEAVPLGQPAVLRSEVLGGMWIPVEWLWRRPLPRQMWVYGEWGLV